MISTFAGNSFSEDIICTGQYRSHFLPVENRCFPHTNLQHYCIYAFNLLKSEVLLLLSALQFICSLLHCFKTFFKREYGQEKVPGYILPTVSNKQMTVDLLGALVLSSLKYYNFKCTVIIGISLHLVYSSHLGLPRYFSLHCCITKQILYSP